MLHAAQEKIAVFENKYIIITFADFEKAWLAK